MTRRDLERVVDEALGEAVGGYFSGFELQYADGPAAASAIVSQMAEPARFPVSADDLEGPVLRAISAAAQGSAGAGGLQCSRPRDLAELVADRLNLAHGVERGGA